MKLYDFKSAVLVSHLHNYYSLLDVLVVPGAVLMHVPFIKDVYRLFNIVAFPSSMTHGHEMKTVTLDGSPILFCTIMLYNNLLICPCYL